MSTCVKNLREIIGSIFLYPFFAISDASAFLVKCKVYICAINAKNCRENGYLLPSSSTLAH